MIVKNLSPGLCCWHLYGGGVIALAHVEGRHSKCFVVLRRLIKSAELRPGPHTEPRIQAMIEVDG